MNKFTDFFRKKEESSSQEANCNAQESAALSQESLSINKNLDIQKETKRINSIDRFRGFCVFSMLIFQFLLKFKNLSFLSRLAQHITYPDPIVILPNLALADIIAPAFIFAIGLTFAMSFTKRQKLYGTITTTIHYLQRALAIVGLGCFLGLCNYMLDMFGGKHELNKFDITVLVFSACMLIGVILRLIALIPNFKKTIFPKIAEQFFYISIAILGILNIVIACVDWNSIVNTGITMYPKYWVTLQDIGFAILVALPIVKARPYLKLVYAGIIFVCFASYHQMPGNMELIDIPVHGGIIGCLGWGAMLVFSMFIADVYFKKSKSSALAISAFSCGLGIFLTQWLGQINLGSCSPTYILTTVGLSGIIFMIFDYCDKYYRSKFDPLVWWGKNPIVMFLVEFFVLGIYTSVAPDSLVKDAPVWLALLEGAIAIVGLTAFTYALSKKKKTISL